TELTDNAGHSLQPLSALDRQVIGRYDVPPYVNRADQSGAVPLLDIGNRYVLAGAQYDPQVLAGLSAAQIAAQLRNPSSPVAQAIDGSAQVIVAGPNQGLDRHARHGQGDRGGHHPGPARPGRPGLERRVSRGSWPARGPGRS